MRFSFVGFNEANSDLYVNPIQARTTLSSSSSKRWTRISKGVTTLLSSLNLWEGIQRTIRSRRAHYACIISPSNDPSRSFSILNTIPSVTHHQTWLCATANCFGRYIWLLAHNLLDRTLAYGEAWRTATEHRVTNCWFKKKYDEACRYCLLYWPLKKHDRDDHTRRYQIASWMISKPRHVLNGTVLKAWERKCHFTSHFTSSCTFRVDHDEQSEVRSILARLQDGILNSCIVASLSRITMLASRPSLWCQNPTLKGVLDRAMTLLALDIFSLRINTRNERGPDALAIMVVLNVRLGPCLLPGMA